MIALAKSKTKRDFPGRIMEAFDLYSPEIDANPFPYYEILREQYPCYWSESGKLWILSRYDDIVEATRDWETFSSSQGNMIDELPGRAGATLGTTDPPRHDRLRALSQAAFARRNVEQFITPTLEIADRVLARVCERKDFEFINDFSSQITVGVLFRTMGLPQPCRHQAQGHSRGLDRQVREGPQRGAYRRLQGAQRLPHRRGGSAPREPDRGPHHPSRRSRDRRRPIERARGRAHDGDLRHGRSGIALELHEHVRAQSARSSRRTPPRRREPRADRTSDRGVAALQHLGAAFQAHGHARDRAARPKNARWRQSGACVRLRQSRLAEISQPGCLRHRSSAARPSRLWRRQALLPRQPNGAARHRGRNEAFSRTRARIPSCDR